MTELSRRIAALEAEPRALKKAARLERLSKTLADPAVRAKMSAASKAAWAEREERELQPKRKRELRRDLGSVPQDAYEQRLFGNRKR